MSEWINALSMLEKQNRAFTLVTILAVRGSSPRTESTKMIVTSEEIFGSIGGGSLEHAAMNFSRELLDAGQPALERRDYTLGKDLTQCCGGEVELLFEVFPACSFHITLYGAGHVGRALVRILAGLPCRVDWLDSRSGLLHEAYSAIGEPGNVFPQTLNNPYDQVERSPEHSFHLIMTHSHETDFEVCEAVLGNTVSEYCGLIGSRSKANSFRGRLKRKGFSGQEIDRLISPMGIDVGKGKMPMEVAVSIAAQLMQLQAERNSENNSGSVSIEQSARNISVIKPS